MDAGVHVRMLVRLRVLEWVGYICNGEKRGVRGSCVVGEIVGRGWRCWRGAKDLCETRGEEGGGGTCTWKSLTFSLLRARYVICILLGLSLHAAAFFFSSPFSAPLLLFASLSPSSVGRFLLRVVSLSPRLCLALGPSPCKKKKLPQMFASPDYMGTSERTVTAELRPHRNNHEWDGR